LADKLNRGYLVKPEFSTDQNLNGIDPQWMREFSIAARDLRNGYDTGENAGKLGTFEYTVTDYGVHIVYLSDVTVGNRVLMLTDYTTSAQTQTVRQKIYDTLVTVDQNNAYQTWQNQLLVNIENANLVSVTKIKNNYKSLWK